MKLPTVVLRPAILHSWLTIAGFSKTELAEELEVSRARVSQLMSAKAEPSAHLIAKLIILTGLPFVRLFKIENRQRGRP